MNLLSEIQGTWMIEPLAAQSYLPFVSALLEGKQPSAYKTTPKAYTEVVRVPVGEGRAATSVEVAVHNVQGVVTKYSQWCGPRGTIELMSDLTKADNDPDIKAHLFVLDTPGGAGGNLNTTMRHIQALQKPTIAFVSGMAASAGYGIAAACDEIYCEEGSNILGSVGAYCTLMDFREHFAQHGIKLHEIYATPSTEKNADYHASLEGNTDEFKATHLDPLAAEFIQSVRTMRPEIQDDDKVFKGKTYPANTGIQIGLADGLKTFEETLEYTAQLGQNHYNDTDMNHLKVTVGADLQTDSKGGIYLNAEQVAQVEAEFSALKEQPQAESTPVDNAAQDAELKALKEQNSELSSKVTSLEERISSLEGWQKQEQGIRPATTTTKPAPQAEDEANAEDEDWDALNQAYMG